MYLALLLNLTLYFLLFKVADFYEDIGIFLIINVFIYINYGYLCYRFFKDKIKNLKLITAVALLSAFLLFLKTSTLSNDVYRYFWDGWLVKSGINPYLLVPSDSALAQFQSSQLYESLNWKNNFTPYPPIAQIIFTVSQLFYGKFGYLGGKLIFTVPVILSSIFTYKFLGKKLYAILIFNPLIILEVFYSGHLDGYIILFLFLSIYAYIKSKYLLSSFFLTLAVLTKIYPVIFLPFILIDLVRKKKFKNTFAYISTFGVTCFIFYLPFITKSLFPITRYLSLAEEQEYNASFYRYLYQILGLFITNSKELAQTFSYLLFFISGLLFLIKKFSLKLLIVIGITYLAFSPIVFPWYTLFLIPLVLYDAKKSKNFSIIIPLVITQFLVTLSYFEPGKKILREVLLNLEYIGIALTLFAYYKFKGSKTKLLLRR